MKPLPILLIHGFNSGPEIWYDSGFVQALLAGGDLQPDLVRAFLYGEAPDGTYDNRGDVAELAARLAVSIRALAQDAVAAGGPGRVVLIGHSLGGLIARYYLSCQKPDRHGTCYAGDVSHLITLGTPHAGAPLSEAADFVARDSWVWTIVNFFESLKIMGARPASDLARWEAQLRAEKAQARAEAFGPEPAPVPPVGPEGETIAQVSLQDSAALRQIQPDSEIMARINAPGAMPADVKYHLIFGDVALFVDITLWGMQFLRRRLSLGDGAVPRFSASALPNAPYTSFPVLYEHNVRLELGRRPRSDVASGVGDMLPYAFHTRLYADETVQKDVLAQLV